MKAQTLGKVVIRYYKDGTLENVTYTPEPFVISGLENLKIEGSPDPQSCKQQADAIFAKWFENQNQLELADREKWEIVLTPLGTSYWEPTRTQPAVIVYNVKIRENEKTIGSVYPELYL